MNKPFTQRIFLLCLIWFPSYLAFGDSTIFTFINPTLNSPFYKALTITNKGSITYECRKTLSAELKYFIFFTKSESNQHYYLAGIDAINSNGHIYPLAKFKHCSAQNETYRCYYPSGSYIAVEKQPDGSFHSSYYSKKGRKLKADTQLICNAIDMPFYGGIIISKVSPLWLKGEYNPKQRLVNEVIFVHLTYLDKKALQSLIQTLQQHTKVTQLYFQSSYIPKPQLQQLITSLSKRKNITILGFSSCVFESVLPFINQYKQLPHITDWWFSANLRPMAQYIEEEQDKLSFQQQIPFFKTMTSLHLDSDQLWRLAPGEIPKLLSQLPKLRSFSYMPTRRQIPAYTHALAAIIHQSSQLQKLALSTAGLNYSQAKALVDAFEKQPRLKQLELWRFNQLTDQEKGHCFNRFQSYCGPHWDALYTKIDRINLDSEKLFLY